MIRSAHGRARYKDHRSFPHAAVRDANPDLIISSMNLHTWSRDKNLDLIHYFLTLRARPLTALLPSVTRCELIVTLKFYPTHKA